MVKGANLPVSAHLRIAMVLASKVRPRGIGGAAQCMPFGWPTIARPLHDSKRSGLNALALKVVPSQQQAYQWRKRARLAPPLCQERGRGRVHLCLLLYIYS